MLNFSLAQENGDQPLALSSARPAREHRTAVGKLRLLITKSWYESSCFGRDFQMPDS